MAVPNCLVDEHKYDLGCLAPAIFIIAVLSFMRKRVKLKPDLWNGRPALPVAVDFLGDQRFRFIIPFAFGATAASAFNMFFEASAASKDLQGSAWSKAFRGILMTMVYGIINYPYLACLNAEYKIIGYAMGLIYSFVRFLVDLFVYFGCTFGEKDTQQFKKLNIEYISYGAILTNIPVVVCTLFLVGSYSVLLFKEIKKLRVQGLLGFRYVLEKKKAATINLAGKTERAHVNLLFSNQLHQAGKRAPNQNGTWYSSLKNWIYVPRPDFKFSTQFLSSFVVSCIFVYQVTVQLLMSVTLIISISKHLKAKFVGNADLEAIFVAIQLSTDYLITSVLLACLFAIMQLGFFMRSHRNDVLKTYRTRTGLLPDEILHPKMLVGKSLRFCGYQIAFTAVGLLVNMISVFALLLPIYILHLLSKFETVDVILWIKNLILDILPYIITPILVWISLILLSHIVFKDHTYPDISITINNRRLFGIMSYFFFFFNILVGLWAGLLRVVKGAVIGLVYLPRVDRTIMMRGYRKFDKAYMAYIGFLSVLVAFKHPVMLCFCQLLLEGVHGRETGSKTFPRRPRVSGKALNRWFLAVLLVRNPSLVRYRKQGDRIVLKLLSTSDVKLKMHSSDLEDDYDSPPPNSMHLLHV